MPRGNPKGVNHRLGSKHTEATKLKISLAHTGKKKPYMAELNRQRLKGVPKSEEWKRNMSEKMKGRFVSEETRRKMSISMKGKNYKGGSKVPRVLKNQIRKSLDYKLWREAVFSRDGYACQMPNCDSDSRYYIEANHIKLFSEYPALRFEPGNGITLCRPCHQHIRYREEEFENLFKKIITWQ